MEHFGDRQRVDDRIGDVQLVQRRYRRVHVERVEATDERSLGSLRLRVDTRFAQVVRPVGNQWVFELHDLFDVLALLVIDRIEQHVLVGAHSVTFEIALLELHRGGIISLIFNLEETK